MRTKKFLHFAVLFILFFFPAKAFATDGWTFEQIDAACDFTSMWGSSENDIYVGGGKALGGCLYHYDGTGWSSLSLSPFTPIVFDIWGSSSNDVYVVGLVGRYHYNGISWTQFSSSVGQSIWGSSSSDVFAGDTDIKRYDGSTWSTMTIPSMTSPSIRGIWGQSSSDVYAVGVLYDSNIGLILHYDGNAWSWFNTGIENDKYDLYDIWGTGPDDLFAVGGSSKILHYDGASWEPMNAGLSYYDWIYDVWGTSSTNVYAITFTYGDILHYDGQNWSVVEPDFTLPQSNFVSRGYSATADTSSESTPIELQAMWGSSANSIYFAGNSGVILHYEVSDLISLAQFKATPMSRSIRIAWSTESEIDNTGFNLYRSESEDGEYVQINDVLISAEGTPTQGAAYEFVDEGLQNRKTYYYKLEDIDQNGQSTMHGPVNATPRLINLFH